MIIGSLLCAHFWTFIIYLFSIYIFFFPDSFTLKLKNQYNHFCQNLDKSNSIFLDQQICQNKFTSKKFIMLLLDGIGYSQQEDYFFNVTKNDAFLARVWGPQFTRASTPIWETYITGRFSMNMIEVELEQDHLLRQFVLGNHRIAYIGENQIFARFAEHLFSYHYYFENEKYILNGMNCKENLQQFMKKDYNDKLIEKYLKKLSRIDINEKNKQYYYDMFEEDLKEIGVNAEKDWDKCLENIKTEQFNGDDYNIIYWTITVDEWNHGYGKWSVANHFLNYRLGKLLLSLKKWVTQHEEYALIITSDHGGQQYYGQDNIEIHGIYTRENQPFLYIASKALQGHGQDVEIDQTDLPSTVSQFLENVNIPLESDGTPHKVINDPYYELLAYHKNFRQLCALLIRLRPEKNEEFEKELLQTIPGSNEITSSTANDQEKLHTLIEKYKSRIKQLQNKIHGIRQENHNQRPIQFGLFASIILCICEAFLFFQLAKKYKKKLNLNNLYIVIGILGLLAGFSDNITALMVEKFKYEFNMAATILLIIILLLTLLILYFKIKQSQSKYQFYQQQIQHQEMEKQDNKLSQSDLRNNSGNLLSVEDVVKEEKNFFKVLIVIFLCVILNLIIQKLDSFNKIFMINVHHYRNEESNTIVSISIFISYFIFWLIQLFFAFKKYPHWNFQAFMIKLFYFVSIFPMIYYDIVYRKRIQFEGKQHDYTLFVLNIIVQVPILYFLFKYLFFYQPPLTYSKSSSSSAQTNIQYSLVNIQHDDTQPIEMVEYYSQQIPDSTISQEKEKIETIILNPQQPQQSSQISSSLNMSKKDDNIYQLEIFQQMMSLNIFYYSDTVQKLFFCALICPICIYLVKKIHKSQILLFQLILALLLYRLSGVIFEGSGGTYTLNFNRKSMDKTIGKTNLQILLDFLDLLGKLLLFLLIAKFTFSQLAYFAQVYFFVSASHLVLFFWDKGFLVITFMTIPLTMSYFYNIFRTLLLFILKICSQFLKAFKCLQIISAKIENQMEKYGPKLSSLNNKCKKFYNIPFLILDIYIINWVTNYLIYSQQAE